MVIAGRPSWEPREHFIDRDGTINDIFQDYEKAHPLNQVRNKQKRKNNNTGKKRKTRSVDKSPRASKKRKKSE